jgi:uncharacterized protein (TIGR03067 family)
MKMLVSALLAIGSVSSLAAQEPERVAREQLVGVWVGYAVEGKGETPDRGPVKLQLTISAELIKAKEFKGDEVIDHGEGSYEINLNESPRFLDGNKKTLNPKRKEVWLGIYELKGDTLKWCVGRRTRPAVFETKKGAFLLILKRKETIQRRQS